MEALDPCHQEAAVEAPGPSHPADVVETLDPCHQEDVVEDPDLCHPVDVVAALQAVVVVQDWAAAGAGQRAVAVMVDGTIARNQGPLGTEQLNQRRLLPLVTFVDSISFPLLGRQNGTP